MFNVTVGPQAHSLYDFSSQWSLFSNMSQHVSSAKFTCMRLRSDTAQILNQGLKPLVINLQSGVCIDN